MDISSRFVIDKKKLAYRIINQEAVILNLENGVFYSLNETSAIIWQGLSEGKNLEQVLRFLADSFPEVSSKRLQKDLIEFIRDLKNENLIQKK